MSEYTTVTLTKGVKEELSDGMREGETWNGYLQRLQSSHAQQGPAESAKTGFSDVELGQIQEIVQEATQDTGQNDAMGEQFEAAEIEYDRIREIVREEVRRALEELVR